MTQFRALSDSPEGVKVYPNAIISDRSKVFVGSGVTIDDFVVIVVREPIYLGDGVHIAVGTSILGGQSVTIGDWSGISAGVRIFTGTEGFDGLFGPTAPPELRGTCVRLPVSIGRHVLVGTNSVIMPGAAIPDGVVLGALSFVPAERVLVPWGVYVGAPVRLVRFRDKQVVLNKERSLET